MAPAPPVPKPPTCEAITTAAREVATGNGDEEAFISYLAQSGVLGDDLAYTAATGRMNKLIAGITHGTLGQAKKVPAVVNSLYSAWRGTTTPAAGSQMPTAAAAQAAPTAGSQMPSAASAQAAPTAGSQMPTAVAAHAAPTAGSQMPTAAAGAGSAHGGFAGGGAAQAADTAVLGAAWERECAAIDARYLDGDPGLESNNDPDAELQSSSSVTWPCFLAVLRDDFGLGGALLGALANGDLDVRLAEGHNELPPGWVAVSGP
ncbi:hypothetical protein T492DRAFT_906351 [Pavlovales sp. CCMP2436]|nr:hypothetical protein T492DRAFT_906351 [Pavlovales sp. CCMP2436]